MILAVAIEDNNPNSKLSDVCGRSKYFLFIDYKKQTTRIISNPFAASYGGAGIQTSQILISNNCDLLITKSIGAHALSFLNSVNIEVYITSEESASEAIKLFEAGILQPAVNNVSKVFTETKIKNRRNNRYKNNK